MKTVVVRVMCLILAGMMILGTMGYLLSELAFAADSISLKSVDAIVNEEGTPQNVPRIREGYYVDITVTAIFEGKTVADIWDGTNYFLTADINSGSNLKRTTQTIITYNNATAISGGRVQVDISFTKLRYDGVAKRFTVDLTGTNITAVSPSTVISDMEPTKTSSNNNDDDDDDKTDTSNIALATPYVIISQYTYGSGQISAGQKFNLTLTLYNTSENVDVENMMMTITMPEDLMLTSSSNTFYIARLDAQKSITKTVQVTVKPAATPKSHNIDISMKYQYLDWKIKSRQDSTTQESISIPVIQVDRFQLTGIESDLEFVVGQEGYLTINYVNKGRSEVYNISGEITGNIQNPGQNQNKGNLMSGSTGSMDFYVIPNEEGICSGEVIITYEDTNMQERTVSLPFSVPAVDYSMGTGGGIEIDPGWDDPGMIGEPVVETPSKLPFIIGVLVVVGIIVAVVVKKKIDQKRSEALDADL